MKRIRRILVVFIFLALTACGTAQRMGVVPISTNTITSSTQTVSPSGPVSTPGVVATQAELPTAAPQVANPGAPDVADYAITVRLDPPARQLAGREVITYRNTSQKPISDLVFHLYLNAFKSPDTIFMKESGGQLRGDSFDPKENGWIEVSALRLKGGQDLKLDVIEDGTLSRAVLPAPVGPGGQVDLELDFQAKLPRVFARTGWAPDALGDPFFLVGQWFPKLGVWTDVGWNAHVFHGNAEFFADFGSYSVAITVPDNYITGATGLEQGKVKNGDGTQTVSYQASGVIDFAWVASPNLRIVMDKAGTVEIAYLYLPEHEWSKNRELEDTAKSVTQYGEWFGAYPYSRLTVVDVPDQGNGAGGMEYPTFITVGAAVQGSPTQPLNGWTDGLLITTAHEVAHQWWQSMVATNEAEEPWLDEGFADTSTLMLLSQDHALTAKDLDQNNPTLGFFLARRSSFLGDPGLPMDEKAWDYQSWGKYGTAVYAKPDMALLTLGRQLGDDKLIAIMRTYFQRYRFAHPTTADFQQVASEVSGQDLSWFFNGLVYKSATVNYVAKSISGSSFTVDRQGDLAVPVDILVTFGDGSTQSLTWDGKDVEHTFKVAQPVRSFDIDPEHKLLIELNWKDNEMQVK
jgi:hypothetical protein